MNLNKAMIIGNLTRDPEVRTTPSGQSVVNFSVATNFTWTDETGKKQERAEFHNVVAWRKLAEIIGQYLKKGSKIYVEGRLQTRSWDDQSGVKRYRTEIVADNMIMLDRPTTQSAKFAPASSPEPANNYAQPEPAANSQAGDEEINVEDIPF